MVPCGDFEEHSSDAHLDQVWVMKQVIQHIHGLMTWRHTPVTLSSRTILDKGVHCIRLSIAPGLQVHVVVPFLASSWCIRGSTPGDLGAQNALTSQGLVPWFQISFPLFPLLGGLV